MKLIRSTVLAFTLATGLLATVTPAFAGEKAKPKMVSVDAVRTDEATAKMVLKEMMKDKKMKKMMVKEMMKDSDFRSMWQEESASFGRGG